MISERYAKQFCKDDISKIENYDKAVADTTQTWICHHRLGLTLDGEFAHSREDLKRLGMYYNRPYFELIFLTKSEHRNLHNMNLSDETKRKLSEAAKGENNPNYGKTFSDEHRRKLSEAQKGKHSKPKSAEHRRKLSEAAKGKPKSDEHRKKLAEAQKGEKNHNYGRTFSAETKCKMAEARRAYWANKKKNA